MIDPFKGKLNCNQCRQLILNHPPKLTLIPSKLGYDHLCKHCQLQFFFFKGTGPYNQMTSLSHKRPE